MAPPADPFIVDESVRNHQFCKEFRKGAAVYRAMTLADGKLADVNAIVRYVATT